jgi:hypothetical protein
VRRSAKGFVILVCGTGICQLVGIGILIRLHAGIGIARRIQAGSCVTVRTGIDQGLNTAY